MRKKKIFDKVMHIRRLEEEVMILATEVRQHWEFLKRREQTLSGLAIITEGKPLPITIKDVKDHTLPIAVFFFHRKI